MAVDGGGNLCVADTQNHRIRNKVDSAGTITTVVGGSLRTGSDFNGGRHVADEAGLRIRAGRSRPVPRGSIERKRGQARDEERSDRALGGWQEQAAPRTTGCFVRNLSKRHAWKRRKFSTLPDENVDAHNGKVHDGK